jgi:hypothetical protein
MEFACSRALGFACLGLAIGVAMVIVNPDAVGSAQFTCPQTYSVQVGPDCHCPEENDCDLQVTVTTHGQPYSCSVCSWTYSYTITCPGGCASNVSVSNQNVTTDCDPHLRSGKLIKIPCPVGSYDDWASIELGCGFCQ